jgi:hypothetical protein
VVAECAEAVALRDAEEAPAPRHVHENDRVGALHAMLEQHSFIASITHASRSACAFSSGCHSDSGRAVCPSA